MSIISEIPRPTIAPNRTAEIRAQSEIFIAEGELIYGLGSFYRLYWFDHTGIGEVRVDGTVWAESNAGRTAAFAGFYVNRYIINGTVGAEAFVADSDTSSARATAISNGSFGQLVENNGTIFAHVDVGSAIGISHFGPDLVINNAGLIAAHVSGQANTQDSGSTSVYMPNGGWLHNQTGGRILAEGGTAQAIVLGNGVPTIGDPAHNIINDGLIQAVSVGGRESIGILAGSLSPQLMIIENNGVIEADVAIRTASSTHPDTPSDATVINSAGGVIRGDIEGDLGAETVINAGLIVGNILLGEGTDLVDNALGQLDGWVFLDWGNDVFIGGAGNEHVDGGRMDDNLSGGAGDDLLLGGLGDDILEGGVGNDGLYGDYGDDSLVLSEADAAFGGFGNDRFVLTDLAFALIDGGSGFDTISLATLDATVDLAQLLLDDRVGGIEAVDLSASGRAALDASDVVAALDGLRVLGNAGTLALAGNWSLSGSTIIDGELFDIYRAGTVDIHVLQTVAVELVADMPAAAVGLDAIAGGAVAPVLADEPSFSLADPVWNDAFYVINEDTTIGAAEVWRSDPTASYTSVVSAYAHEATVINHGTLESARGIAVSLAYLEMFINYGTISVQDPAENGFAMAYYSGQTVPLINAGTIIATVNGGTAQAATVSVHTGFDDRGFENSGLIRASAVSGEAIAVILTAGGSHINSGEISASGAVRAAGIILDQDMTFNNTGLIQAILTGDQPSDRSAAVVINGVSWTTRLINSGEIEGSVAIRADIPFRFYLGEFNLDNQAGGSITGDILLTSTTDNLVNAGVIRGNVMLGSGNDRFDSRDGTFEGSIDAGEGSDWVYAGRGNHSIDGGSNVDFAIVSGNRADYNITQTSLGVFEVVGADGTDTLSNIEFLQFDDQTIRLLRGSGVSVNFETADPSVYQSAMESLRDFDGNDLGGDGAWLRIGSADVNGDGDIDQILVNDAIGRFATVGTAPDGLTYFEDYSWAGETRVAGIYIDPLVQSGDVVAGSDNDSQRRFQNDLEIENINRVLGSDDYDGDGVWEVYFALTDGTAYLRALMHEDGNIRYANYQSEQEVIDYLTANGYDESTFGDWFSNATDAAETVTFVNEAPKFPTVEALEPTAEMFVRPIDPWQAEFHARPSDEWQSEYFG